MGLNDKELDSFWDISSLIPRKKLPIGKQPDTSTASIENEYKNTKSSSINNTTVIKRYIPTKTLIEKLNNNEYQTIEEYSPKSVLIHKVTIKKKAPQYNYYSSFAKKAVEYMDICGKESEYTPFFSYVPQYDQMKPEQLKYYFWFRECVKKGRYIKTDISYILLYAYELINLSDICEPSKTQYILTELWRLYSKEYPAISSKLATWICDISLLKKLSPPQNGGRDMPRAVFALKEFYIEMPENNINACAHSLIKYCTSYDYRASKFYTAETHELFDTYATGALCEAIKYFSNEEGIFSRLTFGDSNLERDTYAGALCSGDMRYRISVEYCSFSRSNELMFMIGDIIKYSENKIRTHLGIKSKMTVYSITPELKLILDNYFLSALPSIKPKKKAEPKQEYDILYDIPRKKLSLTDAARIEESSWETTRELINAFEEEYIEYTEPIIEEANDEKVNNGADEGSTLNKFGKYEPLLKKMLAGDTNVILEYAQSIGKMPEAIAEEINEIAYDIIGDALIEEIENGYAIIEDYINIDGGSNE